MDMASGSEVVELRGMAPRELVEILDAVSLARKIPRNELVVQVLQEQCNQWVHEASLIARVTRRNPRGSDSERN